MDEPISKVFEILSQYNDDALAPLDAIKECIAVLEASSNDYSRQIELLRSQIGVWGSDDTSLFSAQLVVSRLKEALLSS